VHHEKIQGGAGSCFLVAYSTPIENLPLHQGVPKAPFVHQETSFTHGHYFAKIPVISLPRQIRLLWGGK